MDMLCRPVDSYSSYQKDIDTGLDRKLHMIQRQRLLHTTHEDHPPRVLTALVPFLVPSLLFQLRSRWIASSQFHQREDLGDGFSTFCTCGRVATDHFLVATVLQNIQ